MKKRIINILLFTIYAVFIIYAILFKSDISLIGKFERGIQLIPFYTIENFLFAYGEGRLDFMYFFLNIYGNIIVFIPFSYFLSNLLNKRLRYTKTLILSFLFILGIELSQLIFRIGVFDIDDIILNFLGSFLGIVFHKIYIFIWRNK